MGKTPIPNQEVLISNIIKQQIKGAEVTDYRNNFSHHLELDICDIKYNVTVKSTVADLSIDIESPYPGLRLYSGHILCFIIPYHRFINNDDGSFTDLGVEKIKELLFNVYNIHKLIESNKEKVNLLYSEYKKDMNEYISSLPNPYDVKRGRRRRNIKAKNSVEVDSFKWDYSREFSRLLGYDGSNLMRVIEYFLEEKEMNL